MPPTSSIRHELGEDRWRDFQFLSLCLVVLAIVVWVIHLAIWGIDVRRVPMVRVAMIIGVYMALMVRTRFVEFTFVVVTSVLIGELNSRLMLAATARIDSFWINLAVGLALWSTTAVVFAFAGSRLTRPPVSRV